MLLGAGLGASNVTNAYDLHEWGTFTTVSGSDGQLLSGLEIEEEHLPSFVYSHLGMQPSVYSGNGIVYLPPFKNVKNSSHQIPVMLNQKNELQIGGSFKGMPRAILRNVTVKMESPVIYFYGDDTLKVNVQVGFQGGTISQWYPQRKSGDTPKLVKRGEHKLSESLENMLRAETEMVDLSKWLDFSKPYDGTVEWDLEILPKSQRNSAFTFKSEENTTWTYPRVPYANMVKVGNEYEDYLFYRGIGNFDLPATFSVDAAETVLMRNKSNEAIPFAFAFENIKGRFRYKTIGEIGSGEVAKVAESEWLSPSSKSSQQAEVFQEIRKGLVAQGLTEDEANGMIKTWWKSSFKKLGLRVIWVVPQTDLERILPLQAKFCAREAS